MLKDEDGNLDITHNFQNALFDSLDSFDEESDEKIDDQRLGKCSKYY